MEISTETRKDYARVSWAIFRRLRDAGVKRNNSWTEYERAKKIIEPEKEKNGERRDSIYQAITDWVRI